MGEKAPAIFLFVLGLLTFVPGAIHVFLPDGGAGVIAGLDLSTHGAVIVSVFAWAGATQMAWGALMMWVALFHRALLVLVLTLALLERVVMALNEWWLKPGDIGATVGGDRPPGVYGTLVAIPLIAFFLVWAWRLRSRKQSLAAGS
ncbi:MAG TPA: hypothetical protein PL096_06795 [Micropepsaceae bacterium]|nr:hypothetical protein [Micropepsaceae bacterium]